MFKLVESSQAAFVDNSDQKSQSSGVADAYNYWRNIAQNYMNNLEKDTTDNSKFKKMDTLLSKIRSDLSNQKQSMQRLNFRVINLEQSIQSSQSYLEHIKNSIDSRVSKKGLYDRRLASYIHILARESPYINTNIARFFIYEKLVPWECTIDLYDPPFCSFQADNFKVDRVFIDEDEGEESDLLIEKQIPQTPNLSSSRVMSTSHASLSKSHIRNRLNSSDNRRDNSKRQYMWNCSICVEDPRIPLQSGKMINIDRKSWIEKIDEATNKLYPFIYRLDGIGCPKNPIGRTGM